MMFGLAVYIGDDGYASLMDSLTEREVDFEYVVNQRSLLLSYEDRDDLEKEDYKLIKSYDVPFRGRKSWPSFRSYKPGFYPWLMDDEEARLMLLGMEQSMEVYQEITDGLDMPDMLFDEEVLVKVPHEEKGPVVFQNQVVELEDIAEEAPEVPLAVSELALKRVKKLAKLPAAIEFTMEYMDMPVQNEPDERPVFPLLVLAVDQTQGLIMYQNLVSNDLSPAILQGEFLKMLESIKGIPETIMIDEKRPIF